MPSSGTVNRSFCIRNIKKEFTEFIPGDVITSQYHLDRGEKNEVVIVQDRDRDWFELAQQDADKVGLVNVLKLASRGQMDLSQCAYSDDEGDMDLSGMNPMDPQAIKDAIAQVDDLQKKVDELTTQLAEAQKAAAQSKEEGGNE